MRIAITADPYLPVPPRLYGGIERVVAMLVAGLVRRGHDVTLIAHPDSRTPAPLVPYGVPPHRGWYPRTCELMQIAGALLALRGKVDIIHSFGRLAALAPVLPMRSIKKIQSYQRAIPWRGVRRASRRVIRLCGAQFSPPTPVPSCKRLIAIVNNSPITELLW